MNNTKKQTGSDGEKVAAKYLEEKGYKVLEKNWHSAEGEVDIIAEKDGEVAFVEVKTRRNDEFGNGEDAIDQAKIDKLIMAAESYLEKSGHPEDTLWRVEAIIVEPNEKGELDVALHVPNVEI